MRKAQKERGAVIYHYHSLSPLTSLVGILLSSLHGTEDLCDETELIFFAYHQEAGLES